jgi:tetratricopeptide (TPR) repeat protein
MKKILAVLIALTVCLSRAGALPCGTGQESANVSDKISKDWKRVRTAHFEALSNAPAEKVTEILIQLEAFHRFLVTDILALKTASPVSTVVFLFKDDKSFSKVTPRRADGGKRSVAAFFTQTPDRNYIVMPMERDSTKALRLIYHEYFHYVIHCNNPETPPWMSEGLAEFYSTFEVDPLSGQCNIGRPIDNHILWLRGDKPLPLAQIIPLDEAAKVMNGKDDRRIALFYAESWALVHYLMISQETQRQPQLRDYLAAIKKGLSAEQAFQTAFQTTYADMERELKAYIANKNFFMMHYSWDPEELLAASTVTALTEIEAEYLQEDLKMRMGASADAEAAFRKILARAPSFVPAKIALADLLVRSGRLSETIELLRPIAEGDSADLRTHLVLAEAYAKGKLYEDSVREYRKAAALNGQSKAAWLGVGIATLFLDLPAESDAAMARLQALEAGPQWHQVRAYEAFDAGVYAVGAADARAYIEKGGRGTESSPYMAFLGALCLLKSGQVAESEKLLEEVRPEIAADSWTMKVMDFMQGRTEADKFLSLAKDVNERTEAHAYVGLKDSIAGRRSQAVDHLRWVKDNGTKDFVEYGMSVAELKRLEAGDSPKR